MKENGKQISFLGNASGLELKIRVARFFSNKIAKVTCQSNFSERNNSFNIFSLASYSSYV